MRGLRLPGMALFAALALLTPAAVSADATITIVDGDGAGEGFNDPTAVVAVGGNTATTLGGQRLKCFEKAADVLAELIDSNVEILVNGAWDPLFCTSNSATLGSAGPEQARMNFTGAPRADTWYSIALANKLAGQDLDPGFPDINATFNSSIGTTCSFPNTWYYGLDENAAGNQNDCVTVVMHELLHGLGFLDYVTLSTGAKANGKDDTYMVNLEDHSNTDDWDPVGKTWPNMTDNERKASAIDDGDLHWVGTMTARCSGCMTAGRHATGHVQMYAPNPLEDGSSVAHFDTGASPDEVMEPSYTGPNHDPGLAMKVLNDIGWNNILEVGDYNRNGHSDLVLRHRTKGHNVTWHMNGTSIASGAYFPPTANEAWKVVGSGDFNGDRQEDLLWRNTVSGGNLVWEMQGSTLLKSTFLTSTATSWVVGATCDFNCDGNEDIVWRNTANGTNVIWLMNGTSIASGASLPTNPSASWEIVGAGDFDLDGRCDLLWRNASGGQNVVWHLTGTTLKGSTSLPTSTDTNWKIRGVGDYNQDGKPDIIWQRPSSGAAAVWFMNGTTLLQAKTLPPTPPDRWDIVGPR